SFGVVYQVYSQKEASSQANELYACLPCGSDCDRMVVDKPGNCQHCGMPLALKKSIVFTNVTPAELCNIVAARPDVVLLDVRTPDEFAGRAAEKFGHLKNAINIPIQQLR